MEEVSLPENMYSLTSKFNILFDKKSSNSMSFKAELNKTAYSCYSCRTLFLIKSSLQDHVNRRIITITYKCKHCVASKTFYNRCAFLLHARQHFTLHGGEINLNDVEIVPLAIGMLGFSPNPTLYCNNEDITENDTYINSQFYIPEDNKTGKDIIPLRPYNVLFENKENGKRDLLVLRQICKTVPLCKFVLPEVIMQLLKKTLFVSDTNMTPLNSTTTNVIATTSSSSSTTTTNGSEPEIPIFVLPVISKIESLSNVDEATKGVPCPECRVVQRSSMLLHFLATNRPLDKTLNCSVCKYVAPTKCSLVAHIRIHSNLAPFVCPECGIEFECSKTLRQHMQDVCFHLTKQVRFRCAGKKCGKLFASPLTYGAHFFVHFQSLHKCSVCESVFFQYADFLEHAKQHDQCKPKKSYHCTVCQNLLHVLSEDNYQEHINWHTNDRSRCMYVHICRFCRSYFRSNATFAIHVAKCSKGDKSKGLVTHTCKFCYAKLLCAEKEIFKKCLNCNSTNYFTKDKPKTNEIAETVVSSQTSSKVCLLCEEEIVDADDEGHSRICKYQNPIVSIENISFRRNETLSDSVSESTIASNPQSPVEDNKSVEKSEESIKRRKKRPAGSILIPRSKKSNTSTESITDLQAEEPMTFNGTYYCKLCDFENTDRTIFHEHIVTHRDVSTIFQCMECGECFVVKPTLIKHLMHYHKIADTNAYLVKNDCFDKNAVEQLENYLKLAPGESKEVKENQCTVCLEQFDDKLTLNKHFRIHGMAFLMKNVK